MIVIKLWMYGQFKFNFFTLRFFAIIRNIILILINKKDWLMSLKRFLLSFLGAVHMRKHIPPGRGMFFTEIPPLPLFSPKTIFCSYEKKHSPPNRDLAYSLPRSRPGGIRFLIWTHFPGKAGQGFLLNACVQSNYDF